SRFLSTQFNSFSDWLHSRRHCDKDWQKNVIVIREKISDAVQDMPEDERIVALLQGSYINYFHCVRIVEILKETEINTKNFLGYYSSQRMSDWMNIKKMYEKGNVYLAEGAQILQRMVHYEIPALKKQISKNDQIILDCIKKERDNEKQMIDSKKQYEKELLKMGLKGIHLKKEILSLLNDLPAFLIEVAKSMSILADPLAYYEQFRKYIHQYKAPDCVLLPLCSMLIRKGPNVTAYEWKYGAEPLLIELPSLDIVPDENTESSVDNEIDFGDDSVNADNEINYRDDDLKIEVIEDEKGVVSDGVARDLDALTILENPETRRLIYFELKEVILFEDFFFPLTRSLFIPAYA
ncbi:unnamed protein product, partial [Thelazia callipaeda]|uniref:CDK5RAP3 n=1 Tax=Thelazia callipaeda TaxID=103827 RepID=A0A0N5D8H7_THECL